MVEDRFEIAEAAGMGGMGTVYRARDRVTGDVVALKVLRDARDDHAVRFDREIRVLASLRHPGIVRYVADGHLANGLAWLAMEWLEGESLSKRLARSGLSANESIELARRVAEAIGAAHERGIIHRDIKPSNLFLVGGELDRVKVLDFGVARMVDASRASTRTGVMIGTPGYMAPEQVKSERDITPRADVFAVGCLLFECLTGRAAYPGDNVLAVLAKILLEDPPRLSELRPDLPDAVDELLARTMAKQPEERPRDGTRLAAEIAALGRLESSAASRMMPAVQPAPALTATERRLLCVVLVGAPEQGDDTIVDLPDGESRPEPDDTHSGELPVSTMVELDATVRTHGARLDRLADGSHVITFANTGAASDQVMQAARCALALKAIVPASPIALATGRGVLAGRWPVGEAIDRAARLLGVGAQWVRLDDITAGLLDARFDIGGDDAGLFLAGERDAVEVRRTLLGKATACVGRDRELGVLSGLFHECVAEPIARAVLVTGVEGIGKSRVRFELLRRIEAAPPEGSPVEVWFGRGDPLRAGSPYGILAPALRRACGIHEGEPLEVSRQKLRARVMRNASTDLLTTTRFLGEIIGTPFPDDDSVELAAARADPLLMTDQVRRAFEHFLAVETAAQPVLIVLEDVHWGDLPTVKLIDAALRALPDRPWMVLALARPTVHELFPRMWHDRGVQEVRLEELTKKGAERLVRRALAERADEALVARLVEQGGGNAFYLEELVRAAVEGKGDTLPGTVLALVAGRLERLEADARRVLRAASVFGRQFWRDAVVELVGAPRATTTSAWLDELVERELIAKMPAGSGLRDDAYQFRHAIVQEAAYAMLTDTDRELGHALAGEWLERANETDAMVLAEHYQRAGDPRAREHFLRAAEQALAACDFGSAKARTQLGVDCDATGEILGALRLVEAEALKWAGEFAAARAPSREAMNLLPVGSARWFAAAREAADAYGKLDDVDSLSGIGEALRAAPANAGTVNVRIAAIAQAAFQLFSHGLFDLAMDLLDRIEQLSGDDVGPGVLARVYQARSSRAMYDGDAGAYLETELAAAAAFERAGDERYACMQRGHVGYACLEIGAYADAELHLREALASGLRLGLSNVVATAKHNLGRALQLQGQLAEALAIESEAVALFVAQGDHRLESAAHTYLAYILYELGELDRAEAELARSLELALPPIRPQILASQAYVFLAQNRVADALARATDAQHEFDEIGGVEEGESLIRLMLVEARLASGDRDGAREAVHAAHARLQARASRISDPERRRMFLEQIPENVRTLELARTLA